MDDDEVFTPDMGWLTCRYKYEAPGDDGMDPYYRCTVHDAITIGHQGLLPERLRVHDRGPGRRPR